MRFLPLLFGLLAATSCRAAVVYDFTPVTQQIDGILQANPSINGASLIVIRNGTVIYTQYFGTYTSTTRIPIASASKWLSALAIERLVEKQQMSWSDTIGKYIPSAPSDKLNITLGQLFSHTSGLTQNDDACLGDQTNYTLATCAQKILNTTLQYQPGSAFAYTGNGMQVGGYMATLATGKTWDQIFQDEVTTPLGMTDTDFATVSLKPPYVTVPNPQVAGGLRSTMLDYANAVQMVAQHGQWNGTQYLSANDIADMQKDQTHGAPIIYTPDPFVYYGYGYGEWRDSVDAQGNAVQVSSTGKFATSPWVDNSTGVAAVFLVYNSYATLANDLRDLWHNVHDVVTDPIFSDGFE
ncbi:MAG: class A beta-lactamase-related serine hydrolase [Xanthomonadales bacterium PRO7]|jgi:CubicO group peptidase (beta-lactamase class C family)|nr:class A beta-lactamase-related serine hydrolase [Xanthomonadales bacterium PRO7]HMM58042.1 serine hydrolase domain-containing protein [Rudaea sp.]